MGTNQHLDRARRYTYRESVKPVMNPGATARRHSERMFTSADDRNYFMFIFNLIRQQDDLGRDTDTFYRAYTADHNHVAVAAYIEALASNRPTGWAQ